MKLLKKIKTRINEIHSLSDFFSYCYEKFKIYRVVSSKTNLQIRFFLKSGHILNLKDPKTFNEKIQWLKLYAYKPEYQNMVDKYDSRQIIIKKLIEYGYKNPEQYIVPLLGIWNSFEDIDFSILPEKFVLKVTHDSGGVHILRQNKFKLEDESHFFNKRMKYNHYYKSSELVYKNLQPRLIAEKFLEGELNSPVDDIKCMCFNGKAKCFFHTTDRSIGLKVTWFDLDWNRMPFERKYPALDKDIIVKKPTNLKLMIKIAEALSSDIPFLRVDFYEFEDKLFIGELTFYPGSGMEFFKPWEWDKKFGDWLVLPKKEMNY